jgi:hypothetical protein
MFLGIFNVGLLITTSHRYYWLEGISDLLNSTKFKTKER